MCSSVGEIWGHSCARYIHSLSTSIAAMTSNAVTFFTHHLLLVISCRKIFRGFIQLLATSWTLSLPDGTLVAENYSLSVAAASSLAGPFQYQNLIGLDSQVLGSWLDIYICLVARSKPAFVRVNSIFRYQSVTSLEELMVQPGETQHL